MQENEKKKEVKDESSCSLSDLIVWNITKALQKNPTMDLKAAMKSAEEHLEADMNLMLQQFPEERHLVCAILAWQQLGHSDVESLHNFFETVQRNTALSENVPSTCSSKEIMSNKDSKAQKYVDSPSFVSYSKGVVVRLPTSSQPKVVMRLDGACSQRSCPTPKKKDTASKLDAACCKDSECLKKLASLDKTTRELRTRAAQMAKREANRVELLERAEAAWRDLEMGYKRRLSLAIEKEKDLSSQLEKMIDERNSYKKVGSKLMAELNKRTDLAEKDKKDLLAKDQEVCALACAKLRKFQECSQAEGALADQQCKITQLERDLQLREAQTAAKFQARQSEVESTRAMSIEAERVLRAELAGLREQVAAVSAELLIKDKETGKLQIELEKLRERKLKLLTEQEGCQAGCDNKIKDQLEVLNKKRENLQKLMEEAIECQCKFPVDATVEVKRTASLAALCNCTRQDALSKSCSCTSMRERLISCLLKDLFGGLQDELGDNGQQMPCQLLKCLEDSHNWDKASVVKTNLRNYFSELLLGELDIAIATAIEKCHVRWVGECCVDVKSRKPREDHWDASRMDCSRHKGVSNKLAGTSFSGQSDHMAQHPQEPKQFGPDSCFCKAAYTCLVNSRFPNASPAPLRQPRSASPSLTWKRTFNDVAELKQQIEELKKDSIKKADLKHMEQKLTKIVQQASVVDSTVDITPIKEVITEDYSNKNNMKSNTRDVSYALPLKSTTKKKKYTESNILIKNGGKKCFSEKNINGKINKFNKILTPTYAVNVCLCRTGKPQECPNKMQESQVIHNQNNERSQNISKDYVNLSQLSSVRQTKPINTVNTLEDANLEYNKQQTCKSNCVCFNKKPSNTSLDKLLETLLKWKNDLSAADEVCDEMPSISDHDNKMAKHANNSEDCNPKVKINKDKSISLNNDGSHQVVDAITENIKQNNILPTESEYLGAIYFDKSNEFFCKCDERDEAHLNKLHNKTEPQDVNSSILLKCTNVDSCNCKTTIKQNCASCSPIPLTKTKSSKRVQINYVTNENIDKSYQDKETAAVDEKAIPAKKVDYQIKFLGVTLADAGSYKFGGTSKKIDEYTQNSNLAKKMEDENILNNIEYIKPDSRAENALENNGHGNMEKFGIPKNLESCVCCVKNTESSKDLELNTFCLIKDHLKRKLEEFKTSKSYCIPPQEEDKLFTDVIEKVKQVITDTAKEIKCKCAGQSSDTNGTWNRAFSLLQEYLKMKLHRVQCSCASQDDNKENVLADVTQKVCKLIELDFERLKDICTCKNAEFSDKTMDDVTVLAENGIDKFPITEINCDDNSILSRASKNNSAKSAILTENISSQVPPGLGMDTKSCDAMSVRTKFVQATETFDPNMENCLKTEDFKCLGFIPCCDAKNYTDRCFISPQNVLVGMCTNSTPSYKDDPNNLTACKNKSLTEQEPDYETPKNIVQSNLNKTNNKTGDSFFEKKTCNNVPYIGYTIDCACDRNLGACVCMKSVIDNNEDKMTNIINIYNASNYKNYSKNLSYIMKSPRVNAESKSSIKTLNNLNHEWCQSEVNTNKSDEVIIKKSSEKIADNLLNDNTTNTIEDGIISMGTDNSNIEETMDWFECSPLARNEETTKDMLKNSILFPQIEYNNLHDSKIDQEETKFNVVDQKCDCKVVPICHVKMLVENIENNLLNSRCTCDSMIPQVCPVHSNNV